MNTYDNLNGRHCPYCANGILTFQVGNIFDYVCMMCGNTFTPKGVTDYARTWLESVSLRLLKLEKQPDDKHELIEKCTHIPYDEIFVALRDYLCVKTGKNPSERIDVAVIKYIDELESSNKKYRETITSIYMETTK